MQTLLTGAHVYIGNGFKLSDVLIDNGCIVSISEEASFLCAKGALVYNLTDKYIFPGFVDVHVHFREPGFSYKETIETGSQAAAAGGYTDVCTMPNLDPVPDRPEALAVQEKAIKKADMMNVHPYGSITCAERGERLSDMEGLSDRVIAFSDDGKGVADEKMMREAMLKAKSLGKIIAAHCEDMSCIKGSRVHDGRIAAVLGISGITSESEWKMIERDVRLAEETGCSYHVCHVSTAESIDIIRRAKARGVDVTCETAPHYLMLSESDIIERMQIKGESPAALGRFKMNPPLRAESDRKAVLAGLIDGTVDMIATDHAPHSEEEKAGGLMNAPMGVTGLECAFPILYTGLVKEEFLSLEELVRLMSIAPAGRFGIKCGIEEGNTAKLCVYDLDERYVVDPSRFRSKGRSTPFEGCEVFGRCLMTVCGDKVYKADGLNAQRV